METQGRRPALGGYVRSFQEKLITILLISLLVACSSDEDSNDDGNTKPPPVTHSLSITVNGSGTVTSSPNGIDCGVDCSEDYAENTAITLSATPDANSIFVGWSGDADCADGSISLAADTSCTATFDLTHNLSISKVGTGGGVVTTDPIGIDCGMSCSHDFAKNTVIILNTIPDANSIFAGWSGDADCSDGSISLAADTSCTATFNLRPAVSHTLSIINAGTGSGTVTSNPTGISCGTDCSEDFGQGSNVTLSAVPNSGSVFAGWTGNADCADGNVIVNSSLSCTATFNLITYTLAVSANTGTGTGIVTSSPVGIDCGSDCTENYSDGAVVDLTTTPSVGSNFAGWTGDADCDDGSITMNRNVTCNAVFDLVTATTEVIVIADAGHIVEISLGSVAQLNGSLSTTTSTDPLSFLWSISSKPYGSTVAVDLGAEANSERPRFTPDVPGTYMVQLVVSAGGVTSQRVITLVEVADPTNPVPHYRHNTLNFNCMNCHNGTNMQSNGLLITPKSGDHIATSNLCAACHTTYGFSLRRFVDHVEVVGLCIECHNGDIAVGKSEWHIESGDACEDCHDTISFFTLDSEGNFDHSGVSRACGTCHNGAISIGKNEGHINTTLECGFCHTTDAFSPAPFTEDHAAFRNNCAASGCHGNGATGQSVGHPVTSLDCSVCHNTQTFVIEGVFHHRVDPSLQRCDSCHNGVISIGTEAKTDGPHVDITVGSGPDKDCGLCHSSNNDPTTGLPSFANAVFDHSILTPDQLINCGASTCHDANSISGAHARDAAVHVPTNGNDCHLCHSPGTDSQGNPVGIGSFAYGVFDHNTLAPTTRCDSCHNDGITAGVAADHIPLTTEDCDLCHLTTDTFAGATVNHSIITSDCASCHNAVIATGKPAGNAAHVPTDDDCSVCHANTNYPNFAPASNFVHQPETIPNNSRGCLSCHNGRFEPLVQGKPIRTHIPASNDCSVCHTTSDTRFATATNFTHPVFNGGGCEGCHTGQFTTNVPTILGKQNSAAPNGHVPTVQDCDTCHADINDWANRKAPYLQHAGITRDCYTCHNLNGDYDVNGARGVENDTDPNNGVHPAINVSSRGVHTPDCIACHSAPSSSNPTVTFATHFVDHSTIVSGCTDGGCHAAERVTALDKGLHPSPTDGNDCEVCHTGGGTWTEAVFDHSNVTRTTVCEDCHNGTDATGKDARLDRTGVAHVDTTADCRVCHNTTEFAGATFNHQGITRDCIACHDGNAATGKPNNHVPTNDDCYVCHQTTGFVPGDFAHTAAQISGRRCDSCHNGTNATGKADKPVGTHVLTNQDCGVCHNTDTFVGGVFDHSTVSNTTRCDSCHVNGSATATGKDDAVNHIATTADCRACHETGTFAGAQFDHAGITNNCNRSGCHGSGATGQPTTGHFVTSVDCAACHVTTTWADQGTFNHCPNGNVTRKCTTRSGGVYPGNHRAGKATCRDCHRSNTETVTYPNQAQYAPDCAGCHAGDFRRQGDHIGGSNGTVAQNKDCGASGCHRVSGNGF